MSFHLSKDMFDAVPISVAFVSEIEIMSLAGVVQCFVAVDEKHDVDDAVFLAQFRNE
ncbi:hypothetical protein JCM18750_37510 [Halostagnicola bangensis]